MTASALMMRQKRIAVWLAVFVHTAGLAMAGRLRLVPRAVVLVGIGRPMLVAAMADLVEFRRHATMDLGPPKLAAGLIGTTGPAHSVQELVVPRAEQRIRVHVARVAVTYPVWVTRITWVTRTGRILWALRIV